MKELFVDKTDKFIKYLKLTQCGEFELRKDVNNPFQLKFAQ